MNRFYRLQLILVVTSQSILGISCTETVETAETIAPPKKSSVNERSKEKEAHRTREDLARENKQIRSEARNASASDREPLSSIEESIRDSEFVQSDDSAADKPGKGGAETRGFTYDEFDSSSWESTDGRPKSFAKTADQLNDSHRTSHQNYQEGSFRRPQKTRNKDFTNWDGLSNLGNSEWKVQPVVAGVEASR